eukprot:364647-Chlamydomonas_euryale.AAC.7
MVCHDTTQAAEVKDFAVEFSPASGCLDGPTGRAELFILDGSPDGRGPAARGPRPASRDPSRDRRRKRDPSCGRRVTVAESATRPRPRPGPSAAALQ